MTKKTVVSMFLVILLVTEYFTPYLSIVKAAITLPPSSVDDTIPLTISPSLEGNTTWYYQDLMDVRKNTGELIGQAYQYRASNGTLRTLVNPGSIEQWVTAVNGNTDYAVSKQKWYRFQPPSPKVGFDRVLLSDILTDSAASYTNRGSYIEVTPSSRPKITTFSPSSAIQGCYKEKDELPIKIGIEEYVPTSTNARIQIYSYDGTYQLVTDQQVQTNGSGQWSSTIKVPLNHIGKMKFGIRLFDGIDRLDQDTQNTPIDFGSNKVGKTFEICIEPNIKQDAESLPLFDYKDTTYLLSDRLMPYGPLVRVNDSIKHNPGGNSLWLGPLRYATLFRGKLSDGAHSTAKNTTFSITGRHWKPIDVYAYQLPFLHLAGPVKDNVPYGGKIHDSIETDGFNVQKIEMFNPTIIHDMYNGNGQWVVDNAPKHEIRNRKTHFNYGKYFYIRDLAYYSGGAVDNILTTRNDTALQIYQTDYPDITKFEEKPGNTHKVGDKVQLDFNGYEYVSENRTKVKWVIEIIEGPNKGGKINGDGSLNLKSSKGMKNPAKPHMDSYVGKYQAGTTYFTPMQEGVYKLKLTVTDEVMRSSEKTISVAIGDGVTPPPEPGGSCSVDFVPDGDGGQMNQTVTTPNPLGSITSDNGQFDVVQGIPSSEFLRTNASSEEYLVDQSFVQKRGNVVFNGIPVTKTFTLKWTEEKKTTGPDGKEKIEKIPKEEQEVKTVVVDGIKRPYSFWQINKYTIHQFQSAILSNYALPNGSVTMPSNIRLTASGSHNADIKQHVFPTTCPGTITLPPQTITGGTTKPPAPDITGEAKTTAEGKIGQNNVKNDKAEFKGSLVMNDAMTPINGPTPSSVPLPTKVNVTQGGHLIDPLKTNYYRSKSTGSVLYSEVVNINGSGGNKTFPFSVNDVTVHTPVVIYAKMSDDKEHDQRTDPPNRSTPANPNTDRHALILDRSFTITMATEGQHRNIPGYGYRDYAKYTKSKRVKFPFDVYSESKGTFYPANTWIDLAVQEVNKTFFLPVWVPEGQYTAEFQVFAINAPSSNYGTEQEANITIPNSAWNIPPAAQQSAAHSATDTIAVDVVGRLYDFRVTDISDYAWESVFRKRANSPLHTGNYYWVGDKDIDGALRGNEHPFVLPIMPGKHPQYENISVKTGYHFKFDLKSKGDMFNEGDGIRIKPTFYFVDKKGQNQQEVDLYYSNDTKPFIKIGGADDKESRYVIMDSRLRNVPQDKLIDAADFAFSHYSNTQTSNRTQFIQQYLEAAQKKTLVGTFDWMILPYKLKTHIGPTTVPSNASADVLRAKASIQQWYGEYSLPANVKAVKKGTNLARFPKLTDHSPVFLKDGYIVVNFNIESIQNQDLDNPHLQYIDGPLRNQWKAEGFKNSQTDASNNVFSLKDGDVVFYHADKSSLDDFKSNLTH